MSARILDPVDDRALPEPEPDVPPGHVEVSVLTDHGVPARVCLPAEHPLLSAVLARKSTRVRRTAPGVVLPAPEPTPEPAP
ncbi:hypothetical protein [Cellulosimicrobium cellulans]|uniref:Uncharacterized protein n=1 Tax=Cellulosimicrobium cellulans TaxID=1710 RepID=A0A4Y4DWW9_CELCE|nr:hypothetical protein [Cellulosimicrobium cellulans]GED09167.1 hypothetical protein CCE02nite_11660 [Cellulosimicrobium cellulans]